MTHLKTALSVLLLTTFLAACSSTVTKVQTVKLTPPQELLTCKDAPTVPPEPRTQRDVAIYIAELRQAHQDCHATVEELKRWVGQEPVQ